MSKSFMLLLVFVAALGAALGASFVAGVIYGQSQQPDNASLSPRLSADAQPPSNSPGNSPGGGEPGQRPGRRRPPASAEETGEVATQPGGTAADESSGAPVNTATVAPSVTDNQDFRASRNILTGTANQLEGSMLTVTTPEGDRQVSLADNTEIQQITSATIAEVYHGITVGVVGRPREDGILSARILIIIPEGAANPFGGGRRGDLPRGPSP